MLGHDNAASIGPGIHLAEMRGISRLWISPFQNQAEEVNARMSNAFGCRLPALRRFVVGDRLTLLWADAEGWWAEALDAQPSAILGEIASALYGRAAIVDQSGGYVFLRLIGPRVKDLLSGGCAVDLHPDAFPIGSCAPTIMAHCRVHLRVEATATFAILIPRSYAQSFRDWLEVAALEFGLQSEQT